MELKVSANYGNKSENSSTILYEINSQEFHYHYYRIYRSCPRNFLEG